MAGFDFAWVGDKWVSIEFLAMIYDSTYEAMVRYLHGWAPPVTRLPSGAMAIKLAPVIENIGDAPHWNCRN